MKSAVLSLGLVAACAAAPEGPRFADADYPGELRMPAALPFDVVWQQRVTAFWGEGRQRGFDAAVQKRGDTLTVLGLSPMGSVGFAVVMENDAVQVTNNTEEELPFPPRFILLDVQRAFYPWIADGPIHGAPRRGARTALVDGETVEERWSAGRLRERRFRRGDGPDGEIVVRYEWGEDAWRGPSRVLLDNGWFGYRLQVDTHAETLLKPELEGLE